MKRFISQLAATIACAFAALTARPAAPAKTPEPSTQAAATLSIGPITYFQTHCNRCHGDYGSFFPAAFAEQKSDEDLVQVVGEMTRGPGNAPLEGADLAALVAFHRAISREEPFVVTLKHDNNQFAGECSPESVIEVIENGKSIAATVEEHTWHAAARNPTEVVATKDGKKIRLVDAVYSHAK